MGKQWKQCQTLFWGGSKITADGDCSHEIKRRLLLGRKVMTNLDSIFKSRHYFADKGPSSQGYGSSSGHVWMRELDCEESWVPKNWCFFFFHLRLSFISHFFCSFKQTFLCFFFFTLQYCIGFSIHQHVLLNCGVGEDSWESLGLQGDPTSPFWRRSTLGFLWKEWC